jgi:uncharacterized delta-60 repeat protein
VTRARKLLVSVLFCSPGMLGAGPANAAAGALDPTFGQGGQVTVSLSNNNVIAEDALLQPDGKILVAVEITEIVADANAADTFGVLRLLPNGSLDPSFGTGGVSRIAFGGPSALALQADGKIVVVGGPSGSSGFGVARFNANGTPDTSFGTGGTVTTNPVGFPLTSVTAVVVDPNNGQILVGGSAKACAKCVTDTALARYNANGSLDLSFGNEGTVVVQAIGAATTLALLSSGDILTAQGEAIVEFGPNGSLHSSVTSTVSGATIVATSQGGQTVFQTNGDFVFASSVQGELGRRDIDIQLVRFLPQGSLDGTFNSPVFDFGAEAAIAESARALVLQSNGQILAGGGAGQFGAGGFGLARFNSSGSFDTTFGSAGKLTTPFPNADANIGELLLQANGEIVAVGTEIVNGGGPANLVAARYLGQ